MDPREDRTCEVFEMLVNRLTGAESGLHEVKVLIQEQQGLLLKHIEADSLRIQRERQVPYLEEIYYYDGVYQEFYTFDDPIVKGHVVGSVEVRLEVPKPRGDHSASSFMIPCTHMARVWLTVDDPDALASWDGRGLRDFLDASFPVIRDMRVYLFQEHAQTPTRTCFQIYTRQCAPLLFWDEMVALALDAAATCPPPCPVVYGPSPGQVFVELLTKCDDIDGGEIVFVWDWM